VRSWRQSIETGEAFLFQHRFRRADGVYRWHLTRARAMRDPQGRISMWIGSNTDIHEQKEKEEELRQANEDLQQFAYSASHDLQEPIRNVAVYSEIVAKRYHNLLDADGQQFLGFLTEGGRRLATLINDLLTYTRVGAIDGNLTTVDSSAALRHALSSLAEAIRENEATVTYDTLPQVYMGESHLQQVFQNLIGNALKYRTEDAPQIHISAAYQGAAWRFSVQDNGIGIDPHYKEVIFGVFKRLHRDRKYSGTGIGLAICQRVVERYGGRIWVESSPGKGATFFFTVPEHAPRVHSATA
jgi:light-regulated signal transduction histidine kinase (bacteriophytochrome)